MRSAGFLLLVIGIVGIPACGNTTSPAIENGPTLQITNHAYAIACTPICSSPSPVDPMAVGVWHNPGDTLILLAMVPFDSVACVRISQQAGRAAGWKLYVKSFNQLGAPLYYSADTAIDLTNGPGWDWRIRDSVLQGSGTIQHNATFAAGPACLNPVLRP